MSKSWATIFRSTAAPMIHGKVMSIPDKAMPIMPSSLLPGLRKKYMLKMISTREPCTRAMWLRLAKGITSVFSEEEVENAEKQFVTILQQGMCP